ncbi:GNAT family N-acetyltransferase [Corynebacterium oculi]|uniref:Mycothiol acetyltransferase n=1 Tax=Corynebacterium oculi TaxID=1544416 RepID=A0A0N8W033_9CORY|nr:GNAT family N-acetyltransferase [Corynebacterium oculi]KQB85578.1 Mycothiol acetyltransferase [Corynebacterium oculi]
MLIRSYQPSDRDAAVGVLARAFHGDPSFARVATLATSSDTWGVIHEIFDLQITHEYEPAGVIDVAEENGEILGVALWNTPEGKKAGLSDQATALKRYAKLFGRHLPTMYLRERELAAHHPKFPHWYLYALAVSPAAQGKGVGSQLLKAGMERAGNQAVYLESSTRRSAKLYASLGFAPLGELPLHGEGPTEVAMWLPPSLPEE